MISTRDLSALPDIDALKRLMQSMAMLDAMLSPEWEYRDYSFNAQWSKDEQMGSMRTGSGDDLFALFTEKGCFLKGFDHEAPMTPYRTTPKRIWPGVLDSVPALFARGLHQPAFSMEDTTFCIWRTYGDDRWQRGDIQFPAMQPRFDGQPGDPDGSADMLTRYDGDPQSYFNWATYHYHDGKERAPGLTIDHVRHVYAHQPLTAKLVNEINPALTLAKLKTDIDEIGYPRKK